ncbi:MAG: M24 family metallopeptidase [Patescibacteria group bacterium]|nr:M24 family metallopeptidase [Patescibacteria group bacterium]
MVDQINRINICKNLRQTAAQVFAGVLKHSQGLSETQFRDHVLKQLSVGNQIYGHGWYEPPPFGVSALFAPEQNPKRLLYDNLRKEEFWPQEQSKFGNNCVGLLYASPVDKRTGIIGDFGLTVYNGDSDKIKQYIKKCLEIVEQAVEYAQVGMEFREVNNFAQKLLKENSLNNNRTTPITGKFPKTIGHTIPWSYENFTAEEAAAVASQNFEKVKEIIRVKRINLDEGETFKIPPTIAFTTEIRAEDNKDPGLPNVFFHLIVAFKDGKKEIFGGFNQVFEAVGMDFIKSKY